MKGKNVFLIKVVGGKKEGDLARRNILSFKPLVQEETGESLGRKKKKSKANM